MKKLTIILCIIILFAAGCSSKVTNSKTNNKATYDKVINEYLLALTNKNKAKLNNLLFNDEFNDDQIADLKNTLKSAVLKESKIRKESPDRVVIDAKVEVICYENSIPGGDWVRGKTISPKSFELKKASGKWKVSEWGVIPE